MQQQQQQQAAEIQSVASQGPRPSTNRQYMPPPSVSSSPSSHSPIILPPPVPPHPSKRLANQKRESDQLNSRESSVESPPPEMPPHPKKAQLESSLIDLSSPEKNLKENIYPQRRKTPIRITYQWIVRKNHHLWFIEVIVLKALVITRN